MQLPPQVMVLKAGARLASFRISWLLTAIFQRAYLKMTVANLKSYAAVLGVALVGRGRQQVLVQIAAKLRMDSGNDLCAEVQVEGHSQSDSDSNSEDSQSDGED